MWKEQFVILKSHDAVKSEKRQKGRQILLARHYSQNSFTILKKDWILEVLRQRVFHLKTKNN